MTMNSKMLTQGKPLKVILAFTLPLLIGNVFQQFYNMADTFIVGRTLGVEALAAVGCTGSLTFLILGFAQGITSGFAVKTAQYCGAADGDGVRRSFITGLALSGAVTLVLTLVAAPLTRNMLHLLQTPPELMDGATSYLSIIFWGIGASMLYNHLAGTIRALGDSRTPLIFLVIACLLNIVLDYVLILGAGMGVAGAAVATVAAQLIASALCILYIYRRMPVLVRHASLRDISVGECRRQLASGLPMGFQSSIIAIGSIMLQAALNGLGSTAVAAYTAAGKVDQFATMPLMSIGIAVGTYAAQNYGARQYKRIRQGALQSTIVSVVYSFAMGTVMMLFGAQLVAVFVGGNATQVVEMAQTYLTINGMCYFFLGILFNMRYTLQGIGMSLVPTFAGAVELVMRSAAALLLARIFGFTGACFASPLAWLGAAVPLSVAFFLTMRRLSWQQEAAPPLHLEARGRDKKRSNTIELPLQAVIELPAQASCDA